MHCNIFILQLIKILTIIFTNFNIYTYIILIIKKFNIKINIIYQKQNKLMAACLKIGKERFFFYPAYVLYVVMT